MTLAVGSTADNGPVVIRFQLSPVEPGWLRRGPSVRSTGALFYADYLADPASTHSERRGGSRRDKRKAKAARRARKKQRSRP